MPVYIALLRGINVGPHKRMKMDKLRSTFEALGFTGVKTFIQSGNVVFKGAKSRSVALSKKIEERILIDFGFAADVITRSGQELKQIVQTNPLLKERSIDVSRLHVAFLADAPGPPALKKLATLTLAPDRSCCCGKEVYLYFPNGVSGGSLWKHPLDRVLMVSATMRNWNTVNKIYEMAVACE